MHRFYAPGSSFNSGIIVLADDETHHLRYVLRHATGDEVRVFDGEGNEFHCRVESVKKNEARLSIIGEVRPYAAESPLDLTLAAAILKGEKFDLVIQKAVELGVTRLVPLQTARCEARFKDAEKKLHRWRKIALDATKQCGRARSMFVGHACEFLRFIDRPESENGLWILFSERGGGALDIPRNYENITAFVGPEGGWDDIELNAVRESSIRIVTLGGRTLRAETAAISIAAILQHRFGDLN